MLPAVYPHDVLGILNRVRQRRDYEPVQMPWWKLELDEKRNGQLYVFVHGFLKEHSPLDLVPQTKVRIFSKYLQCLRQTMQEPNLIYLLDQKFVILIFIQRKAIYLNHSTLTVQGIALFLSY